jgi:hypothetical protein
MGCCARWKSRVSILESSECREEQLKCGFFSERSASTENPFRNKPSQSSGEWKSFQTEIVTSYRELGIVNFDESFFDAS